MTAALYVALIELRIIFTESKCTIMPVRGPTVEHPVDVRLVATYHDLQCFSYTHSSRTTDQTVVRAADVPPVIPLQANSFFIVDSLIMIG